MKTKQIITIIGASGFVGRNLIEYLLVKTDYSIRAVCRHPEGIVVPHNHQERVQLISASVFDHRAMVESLAGASAAVYLVHMMGQRGNYVTQEAKAARLLGRAAAVAGLKRLVFLGGLGDDKQKLSKHLKSRHHTGQLLRESAPLVIELRASMIIGNGSSAFEIIKNLVHRLPIQTMPMWCTTKTQPITLLNTLQYITSVLSYPFDQHTTIEIGGPEQLSYQDLVQRYATFCGRKPILILIPIVPLWLGAWWLNLFTPRDHARVGRPMVESLINPMIVTNNLASQLFPDITLEPIESSFT